MSDSPDDERVDAESRRRIRDDLHINFLVEAAAGTGKTASLVSRMVQLIATETCRVDQLVAVTFTRKAASELRDRFQLGLREKLLAEKKAAAPDQSKIEILRKASDQPGQAFIGTIHSLCARLLRERPIEFGVDPAFRELDEQDDRELRRQAWQENMNHLIASGSPLITRLKELDLESLPLQQCFHQFLAYQDVQHWPADSPEEISLEELKSELFTYVKDMQALIPLFPKERRSDEAMAHYELIVRKSDQSIAEPRDFFSLLKLFDRSLKFTQGAWHDTQAGKANQGRWRKFRETIAGPGMAYWARCRYTVVMEILRSARDAYRRLRRASGGLGFDDLLLTAAQGLRQTPELRSYFQGKFSHVLVDEFQDTDPVQAEILMFLTASDPQQQEWTQCIPQPGSLFLVGDPKQSIYRFRRGDFVTYNKVQQIFMASGGETLPLTKNFRTCSDVRKWVNAVFQQKFGADSTEFGPAARNLVHGRKNTADSETENSLQGVFRLTVPNERIETATREEARRIARFIRDAIDSELQFPRTASEQALGRGPAQPRDFLIIPYRKLRMELFQAALEEQGIPCEASGARTFQELPGLKTLLSCLRAIEDPGNPVHLLAILRRSLFGFDDQSLFEFKQAGGRFNFLAPLPDDLEAELQSKIQAAFSRLRSYRRMLHQMSHASAMMRIAQDLGIVAEAASGPEGNFKAGSLLKALETVRLQSQDFDNVADAIDCLERTLNVDESTSCSALPNDGNVVRIMNLHKAKGLEAPMVFLANTGPAPKHEVQCHVDRSTGTSHGYLAITVPKKWKGHTEIAVPLEWEKWQERENEFLDAENIRLLYVATTRAESCLVISEGKKSSQWEPLHEHLDGIPELPSLTASERRKTQEGATTYAATEHDSNHITWSRAWEYAKQTTYRLETAKKIGLRGTSRPDWQASGDYGHLWGSALHDLLEALSKNTSLDLEPVARTLCEEYGLGGQRTDELVGVAKAVASSDIWARSRAAKQCFAEIPFDAPSLSPHKLPTLVRGVIDLVFEEEQGWVIVDYKTDDITRGQAPEALKYYRGQLEEYANYWESITSLRVSEIGLYFTRINAYFAC